MLDPSHCPDPEQLAAFVAGTLSDEELRMVTEHLGRCEDCRFVVREAVHIDREHRAPVAAAGSSSWPWWLRVAATVLIGIVGVGIWWSGPGREKDPIAVLAEASPRDERTVEARVTGFPWAPAPSMRRNGGSQDPGQMKLVGVAGEVLEKQAADPSPRMQHAAAIARLVTGHPKEAAQILDELVRRQPDAKRWSDLAAAQYTVAVQTEDPAALTEALTAADSALALDPRFPEALFNRALILEKLNATPQQAREAWEKYLEVDSTSEWAQEARDRLKDLAPAGLSFKEELERRYDLLVRDPAAARELASRFPREARVWGQMVILRSWADAVLGKESENTPEEHLALARAFGQQLAAANRDLSLRDAVDAIERLPATQLASLANAHVWIREASTRYGQGKVAEAGAMFAEAARAFEAAGSPMAHRARYLHANTLYDRGAIEESHRQLLALLETAPPQYFGHQAELKWQLGLTFAARGQWGESIQMLQKSIEDFERLGEVQYAGNVREILAQAYDRIGDPQKAWRQRMIALQELGRTESIFHRRAILAAATHAANAAGNHRVSLSLLRVMLDRQRIAGDDEIFVEALLLRAREHIRIDEPEAARVDLARVREIVATLEPEPRRFARVTFDAVEAELVPTPAEAVTRLSSAIEYHRERRRMYLPERYLQRGRAFMKLGQVINAAADFESGILELENQRETLAMSHEKLGMFAIAGELFEEAISLALSRGDVAGAFAYAERDRARTLLESIQPPAAQKAAYENATILEYVTLPSELVIFVADGERLHAKRRRISRTAIENEVSRLKRAVATTDAGELETSLARLHEILIAPVKASLRPRAPLVIVHDHILGAVPFIALRDQSGRHLLEDHLVIDAPSAAVHARLAAARRAPPSGPLHLLLLSGARTLDGDLGSLTNIDREMSAIRSQYAQSKQLRATVGLDSFIADAANADVIHFAGHASSDDDVRGAALLTSGGTNGDDRLDVSEIASRPLPRTRVVVLAGCETAGGQERAREGTISTARAFLSTGVPSVIATIWPIDDRAAADFFPRVHRHLARGLPAAEALRSAQLECIREKTTPFLWAAVQVIGS